PSLPVITAAGHVVFREQPAKGCLILVRLYKILLGPTAPQPFDRDKIWLCVSLDGDSPFIQIPMVVVEGSDLAALHAGAKETGGLARQRQALLLDGRDAVLPEPSPVDEGVFVFIFLILGVIDNGM